MRALVLIHQNRNVLDNRLRQKTNFLSPFNLFLPVQSFAQKYFPSSPGQISTRSGAIPVRQEGRCGQSSRNVGRDAVDAGARLTKVRSADGEAVWS